METNISNIEMLDGWLSYLQQDEMLGPVVGRSKSTIVTVMKRLSLFEKNAVCLLECPLVGDPGIDFALQFNTRDFFEGSFFTGKAERFNHFFELYARMVGSQKDFVMEFDTATGTGSQLAVFLDIQERTEQVVAKTLAFQGENRRLAAVQKLLDLAKDMEASKFCFVYSRASMPLRFTFKAREAHTCESIIAFVEKLEQSRQSKALQKALERSEQVKELQANSSILQDLHAIARMKIFNCSLDVDIFPDGNLGPIYGLNLDLRANGVDEQLAALSSEDFAIFYEILNKHQLIDNRFNCINKSIFSVPLPHESGHQEYLNSMIAGFKLRYKQGKRLPAKIFFKGSRG